MNIYADDMSLPMQRLVLGHLFRMTAATSYWLNVIPQVKEIKQLWRGQAKQWYKRTENWINQWHQEILMHGASAGPYEAMLDTQCDWQEKMKDMLFYHEQALKRLLDKLRIPHSDIFSKMATARDLIECAAICNGIEMSLYPNMKCLNQFCGGGSEEINYKDDEIKPTPNIAGRLLKFHTQMTREFYHNIGKKDVIFVDDDPEVSRAISITATKMQETFTDYDWICDAASKHCNEWIADNAEEYAKVVKDVEKGKAKEAERRKTRKHKTGGFSVVTKEGPLPMHGLPQKISDGCVSHFVLEKGQQLPHTRELDLIYSIKIVDLKFDWRVKNALPEAGIVTIKDLLIRGKEQITSIKGIGPAMWQNIRKTIQQLGINIVN